MRYWEICGLKPEFASSMLRRRTFCIPPFQQKRYSDSDENESPNQKSVEVDHAHSCEEESEGSDQKEWTSYSAVKRAIFEPVGETADGHGEEARSR